MLTKQLVNKAAGGDLGSGKLLFGLIATAGDCLFDSAKTMSRDDEAAMAAAMARLTGLKDIG